jgi:acyl-coenzyme A thioesterase PaaI-like protein
MTGSVRSHTKAGRSRCTRSQNGDRVHHARIVSQIGEFVEARCRVVHRTRSLIFMSAELLVGNRVVATANGVWKRWAQIRVGPLVLIGPRFFDLICCHG